MPIFEYKCNQCGHTMEFLEKTRTPSKHACEKCGGAHVQKLLSGFAVGRSKAATQACETCPSGPGQTDMCQTGGCPHSL
ncbi:MAG: zinc ribbon domain-containing protein [Phycisphaerales bacterium]|nr:MAG: zinc ribbon domain-containing protein [Phycisphaerales bacterium]